MYLHMYNDEYDIRLNVHRLSFKRILASFS